jgi:hypothetical protein
LHSVVAAQRGFALPPWRRLVEHFFAWLTRYQWLAKDDERLPKTVTGLHLVAFATLMLGRMVKLLGQKCITPSRLTGLPCEPTHAYQSNSPAFCFSSP